MNPATADTMSKPLSAAKMHEILSKCEWLPNGKLRVQATHRSEELLIKAGVREPRALRFYEVSARRDEKGFLTLNPYHAKTPLLESGDDSLFEPGGIFSGETAPAAAEPDSPRPLSDTAPEVAAELAQFCETLAARTFEVSEGPHSKFRVQVVAFDDAALPSPSEPPNWKPRPATNAQVHAALAALHLARDFAPFEQL